MIIYSQQLFFFLIFHSHKSYLFIQLNQTINIIKRLKYKIYDYEYLYFGKPFFAKLIKNCTPLVCSFICKRDMKYLKICILYIYFHNPYRYNHLFKKLKFNPQSSNNVDKQLRNYFNAVLCL